MSTRMGAVSRAVSRTGGRITLMERLIRTDADSAMLVLRIALAVILFPHGAQHLLGWFGGYGFAGTHQWMTSLGFPGPLAALAIITEFFAPFALLAGAGGRMAALGVIGLMLGALSTHVSNGFFMNWFGAMPAGAEGYEYHLLVIAIAVAIAMRGSGAWSVDRALWSRAERSGVTSTRYSEQIMSGITPRLEGSRYGIEAEAEVGSGI
jgi:putative oxidoreductase